jgi:hypothetical protein
MTDVPVELRIPTPPVVRVLDITAKAGLVGLLLLALFRPDLGNLEDKAAGVRAVAYPLLSFTVPVVWWVWWRERASFPWLADLLVTLTCFTDTLGNRMDLYDTVVWFDDWMHLMNTGLITAAVILLTLPRAAGLWSTLERGLSFGLTSAVVWEVAEYFAFVGRSSESPTAYADTLGDIALGALGAVLAALGIQWSWRQGGLASTAPHLERQAPAPGA